MDGIIDHWLYEPWRERVDAMFFYRGMSAKDLTDPLWPGSDPFVPIRGDLERLIDKLLTLLDAGFEFTIYEDYSGLAFPLQDILAWSRRDLANPGLDFTSRHDIASGYARNFQGSQLKQNFKYITDHLPEHRDAPVPARLMGPDEWQLVARVNRWIARESPDHRPVVVRARRSCRAFESNSQGCLLRGSWPFFRSQVLAALAASGLPSTCEAIEQLLWDPNGHFDVRVVHSLALSDTTIIETWR